MFARWRHTRQGPDREVVLYTRAGCHLCDVALETLQHARQRHGFHLREVDIDSDPALVEAHGLWVPVVTVDGQVRFRGGVNPVLLERLFQGS
jgi:glutaredoxin